MSKQTRGRPKKNQAKRLPQIYRKIFTEHDAVSYGLSLMYVMEIFADTKDQKRIGHSNGSFTSYEKVSNQYSYDSFQEDLQAWGASIILQNQQVKCFCRHLVGMAPKIVLRELIFIVQEFLENVIRNNKSPKQSVKIIRRKYSQMHSANLDKKFKYLRYTNQALSQLKEQKNSELIIQKAADLWPMFLRIFTYCIYCSYLKITNNKYIKPLFSDAANPDDTLIGQLSLKQIVQQTESDSLDETFVQETTSISSSSFVPCLEVSQKTNYVKIEQQQKIEVIQTPKKRTLILLTKPPSMRSIEQ